MAEIVVAQRMWQRRGTAALWASVNPVLQAGEIGFEIETDINLPIKMKVGNGAQAWSDLPYFAGGGSGSIDMRVDSGYIQFTTDGSTWTNLVALSDLQGEPGKNPEFQKTATHLQWRLVGDPTWIDLVALDDIRGADGVPSQRRMHTINGASGTVACDWSLYDEIRINMASDITLTFSGANDGQGCVVKLKQNAVGNNNVNLPAAVRYNAILTTYSHTGGDSVADKLGFVYDGADSKYDFVSIIPGIS